MMLYNDIKQCAYRQCIDPCNRRVTDFVSESTQKAAMFSLGDRCC